MVVSRLYSHARIVFVPLWIHDDGLIRLVTDVDEEFGDIEKCDGSEGG